MERISTTERTLGDCIIGLKQAIYEAIDFLESRDEDCKSHAKRLRDHVDVCGKETRSSPEQLAAVNERWKQFLRDSFHIDA
jgi:hypothetical protein